MVDQNLKSAIVFVCGLTNVGKSSLINTILDSKKTITSHKCDTTRQKVFLPYESPLGQLILIDSPGINYRRDQLSKKLNQISLNALNDNDLIYFITDHKYNKQDKQLLKKLFDQKIPIFCVINKIDLFSNKSKIDEIILSYHEFPFNEFIPLSATKKTHVDKLLQLTFTYAKAQGPIFLTNFNSSLSNDEMICELVREKLFYYTDSELPYASFIKIDHIEDKEYYISIVVEKNSQKKIILGQHGGIIKQIRLQAQHDIKRFLNLNIKLNLFVKVEKNWRNNPKIISQLKLDI